MTVVVVQGNGSLMKLLVLWVDVMKIHAVSRIVLEGGLPATKTANRFTA
jgi:hypothetical protein